MTPRNQFYTVPQAAEILGMDKATVRHLFEIKELTGYRTPGGDTRRGKIKIARASLESYGATLTAPRRRSGKAPSARERMEALG